jgi:hypothetical protein
MTTSWFQSKDENGKVINLPTFFKRNNTTRFIFIFLTPLGFCGDLCNKKVLWLIIYLQALGSLY